MGRAVDAVEEHREVGEGWGEIGGVAGLVKGVDDLVE